MIRCSVSLLATSASVSLRPDQRDVVPQPQQERDRADVILVRVRDYQRLDLVQPVLDVGEVRQDQVDPWLVGLGEQHPAVHDSRRPACSKTVMFRPISPSPPSGTMRKTVGGKRGWRTELWVRVAHLAQLRQSPELHTARDQIGAQPLRPRRWWRRQRRADRPAGQPEQASAALVLIVPCIRVMPV